MKRSVLAFASASTRPIGPTVDRSTRLRDPMLQIPRPPLPGLLGLARSRLASLARAGTLWDVQLSPGFARGVASGG